MPLNPFSLTLGFCNRRALSYSGLLRLSLRPAPSLGLLYSTDLTSVLGLGFWDKPEGSMQVYDIHVGLKGFPLN